MAHCFSVVLCTQLKFPQTIQINDKYYPSKCSRRTSFTNGLIIIADSGLLKPFVTTSAWFEALLFRGITMSRILLTGLLSD